MKKKQRYHSQHLCILKLSYFLHSNSLIVSNMPLFNIIMELREGTILSLKWNINKINCLLGFYKNNIKGQFYFWKIVTAIFSVLYTLPVACHFSIKSCGLSLFLLSLAGPCDASTEQSGSDFQGKLAPS